MSCHAWLTLVLSLISPSMMSYFPQVLPLQSGLFSVSSTPFLFSYACWAGITFKQSLTRLHESMTHLSEFLSRQISPIRICPVDHIFLLSASGTSLAWVCMGKRWPPGLLMPSKNGSPGLLATYHRLNVQRPLHIFPCDNRLLPSTFTGFRGNLLTFQNFA